MNQKYGLITYEGVTDPKTNTFNLGDYVQSVSARQFLPEVNSFVSREELNVYDGNLVKMIMNAWYMANPLNFPPSPKIQPLYVSIHINSTIEDKFFTEETISHFKANEPIGTRDNYTRDLLMSKGVDAYYSGCLTLTLGYTFKRVNPSNEILIVDPMYDLLSGSELLKQPLRLAKRVFNGRLKEYNWRKKVLNKYFEKELLDDAIYITQILDEVPYSKGLQLAEDYIRRLCNAKLVITSRIHCALPCLAMGTPVIFINGGFNTKSESCRFDGLYDFFNRIDVDRATGESTQNFKFDTKIGKNSPISNGNLHIPVAEKLIERCVKFISR